MDMLKAIYNELSRFLKTVALLAFVIVFLGTSVFGSPLNIPSELVVAGNKLKYLGREYDARNDKTYFHYNVSRGLLTPPLYNLEWLLPNAQTTRSLTSVDTLIPHLLSLNGNNDTSSIVFSSLSGLLPSSNINLSLLGNIPEGPLTVKTKVNSNSAPTQGLIIGPVAIDLDLNGGQGGNTPNPTPTPTTGSNPRCLLDASLPLVGNVGEILNLAVPVVDTLNGALKVEYNDWPQSAHCSVPSGSTIGSGQILSIDWKPTESDVGTTKILPLKVTSQANTSVLCDLAINVVQDLIPEINIVPLSLPITCQGLTTAIDLDASASFDPEGKPLTFSWTHNCSNATIANSTSAHASIRLQEPGTGTPQACFATLTVSDGVKVSTSQLDLNVGACDVSCDASQKDQCGVCNGNNLCLDCNGQAFGGQAVDRCGVCGGSNACLDCRGQVNGVAQLDQCGVCGGDGTSCRSCDDVSLRSTLVALDGSAMAQAHTITRALARLKRTAGKKEARVLSARANKLYTESWRTGWSLAQTNSVCSHYTGCLSVSSDSKISDYQKNSSDLQKVGLKAAALLKKYGGVNREKSAKRLQKLVKKQNLESNAAAKLYPEVTNQCA